MIFRYVLAALLLATPAYAQKTKAELNSEIATSFPNNNSGTITPSVLRKVTGDIVSAIMPTAPVVAGNLACFNGITGLLKDCGTAPFLGLIVGTTPIVGGNSGAPLVNNTGFIANGLISSTWATFQQTGTGSVLRTVQDKLTDNGVNVLDKGAQCDWNGTTGTDDSAAINAAVAAASTAKSSVVFPRQCYSSAGINFGAVPVVGARPIAPTNPPNGPGLICAAAIAGPCAIIGVSGATSLGGAVRDMIVGYSGTPVAGDTAFLIRGFNSTFQGILAFNAYDGVTWASGLSSHGNLLFTWNILHDHVVQNGFPEIYISNARFGMNGAGDQAGSSSFIGLTGSDPNSFVCDQCQFNLGSRSPHHLVEYFSLTSQINGVVQITNSIVDMSVGNCQSLIKTDVTSFVYRLQISGSSILASSCPLLDQSAQSSPPVNFQVVNNVLLAIGNSTIDTGAVVNPLSFDISHNANITGNITLNSGSGNGTVGGRGIFSDNLMSGNLTVTSTKPWGQLDMIGNHIGGTYTDTATGTIRANTPPIAFSPVLMIGSTAAILASSSGRSQRTTDGNVLVEWGLNVSSLNSGTGALTVTGNPFTCKANDGLAGGFGNPGGVPLSVGAASGQAMTGAPVAVLNQNTATIVLAQTNSTGLASLTEANVKIGTILAAKLGCLPS